VPAHGRMRAFDRDLIRGGHYGQRSCEPHSKAEHMAAPTKAAANVKKLLPTRSRPHMALSVIAKPQLFWRYWMHSGQRSGRGPDGSAANDQKRTRSRPNVASCLLSPHLSNCNIGQERL
jgi:hypothetical protein